MLCPICLKLNVEDILLYGVLCGSSWLGKHCERLSPMVEKNILKLHLLVLCRYQVCLSMWCIVQIYMIVSMVYLWHHMVYLWDEVIRGISLSLWCICDMRSSEVYHCLYGISVTSGHQRYISLYDVSVISYGISVISGHQRYIIVSMVYMWHQVIRGISLSLWYNCDIRSSEVYHCLYGVSVTSYGVSVISGHQRYIIVYMVYLWHHMVYLWHQTIRGIWLSLWCICDIIGVSVISGHQRYMIVLMVYLWYHMVYLWHQVIRGFHNMDTVLYQVAS